MNIFFRLVMLWFENSNSQYELMTSKLMEHELLPRGGAAFILGCIRVPPNRAILGAKKPYNSVMNYMVCPTIGSKIENFTQQFGVKIVILPYHRVKIFNNNACPKIGYRA